MWRFAAARSVGTSHIKVNLPCQDRFACEIFPGDALVAAVADGAGSAINAEQGAEIAVDTVTRYLKRSLAEDRADYGALLREAAAAAREAILIEAVRKGVESRSYASTLLVVLLTPKGGAALQIGDGVIVAGDGGDEWAWVFWPQHGEYANTTHFLTDEDAAERVQVEVFSGMVADVALMSDGLEPLSLHYASRAVHDPFFKGMFQPLFKAEGSAEISELSAHLEQFLASDQVGSRTDDDVSLILATRRNGDPSGR